MTALTDSEEDEQSDAEQRDEEQPAEKLSVRLERIDCLHLGTDSDKRESLKILLELREEVCKNGCQSAYIQFTDVSVVTTDRTVCFNTFMYFCSLDRTPSFFGG